MSEQEKCAPTRRKLRAAEAGSLSRAIPAAKARRRKTTAERDRELDIALRAAVANPVGGVREAIRRGLRECFQERLEDASDGIGPTAGNA